MSEYSGYAGESLEFLKRHGVAVGDSARFLADIAHVGIVMPRYEHGDDGHVVVKLESGYNVGLEIGKIRAVERIKAAEAPAGGAAAELPARGLPRILLLSTGGTIASRVDYRTGAVTPALSAGDLVSSVPEIAEIADIEAREVMSEHSENMSPEHWTRVAEEIGACAGSGYAGIIVAHGTDTMHYTSAFLSFALAGFPAPVVLVGSQRSSDRASSDAALNLVGAARFIVEEGARGVYVAMHLDGNDGAVACHAGTRVRKNHTSRRGAFQTVGGDPAFVVAEGVSRNLRGEFFGEAEFVPRTGVDPRIALVKYHPGFDPALLDRMVGMGYRGVIFEGTGLGHVGDSLYESIRGAAGKGIFLGMTSQCIDGRVRMTVYESGRDLLDLGIVPLEDMLPEVALVKAMWAFGNFDGPGEAGRVMLENVASEMS